MKNLKTINEFWGAVIRRDMSSAVREEEKFHNKEELKEYLKKEIDKQGKNVVIRDLYLSGIEDLSYLFNGLLNGVETLDLSGWNVSGVKDMGHMFYYCREIKSINLSGWDVSGVEDMSAMFMYCRMLTSVDLSGWNISSLRTMSYMFASCNNLRNLDLSELNTDGVYGKSDVFYACPAPYKIIDNKIVRK